MNNAIARQMYFLAQKLRGENTPDKLEELKRIQWLSPPKIRLQQQQMIEKIIKYATEHVSLYRERLRGIKGYEEFERIPLLTRKEVMTNLDSLISEDCSRNSLLKYHSSGSTGEPVTLYFTPQAMGYFHAAQYRGFSWYGLEPTDRCIKFWGVPFETTARLKEYLKDFVMNRNRISAFNMSEGAMASYYRESLRFRPLYLYGYALALFRFGQYLKETGRDGRALNLKVVISTAEVLYEHQRFLLEEVFGCRVVNEYGAAEVGIIGFECPDGGIHIANENVYLEVLRDGRPAKEGEVGDVVVTGLRNHAMPLIRYKLGDLAAVPSKEHCPCGRGLPLIKSLAGRDNDMVVTAEGKILHSEIFAYINRDLIKDGHRIREFKIIQTAKDLLRVLVPKDTGDNTLFALQQQIKRHIGWDMRIQVEHVDEIPRERSGKVRYFVSELPRL